MLVNGQCYCGAIGFEAEVDPGAVRICHCTDCQVTSGSLFRANIRARSGTFRSLRGSPRHYIKTAESGNKRALAFCAECGSGLYSTSPDDPNNYMLRVGVLAERAAFRPAQQAWCSSALPWTDDVPGVVKRERQ
jgi:hypothetical protein